MRFYLDTVSTSETTSEYPDAETIAKVARRLRGQIAILDLNLYDTDSGSRHSIHIAQSQLTITRTTSKDRVAKQGQAQYTAVGNKPGRYRLINLETLYVAKRFRRKGYATTLLTTIDRIAKSLSDQTGDTVVVTVETIKAFETDDNCFENEPYYKNETLIPTKRNRGTDANDWLYNLLSNSSYPEVLES